jgi:thioredoxin-like negative regulator of GroEL
MATASVNKQIITELTLANFQQMQLNAKKYVIVLKFGAEWCKPCKLIKPTCEEWFKTAPANIIYADIDIDDNIDLYLAFKSKKMVRGVPVLLAFNGAKARDQWYIPDDSVEGGDVAAVKQFFQRINAF